MNIKIGAYKNYKAMCEENGLEVKAGKGKQLQMKEIARFYEFHKEGNKIIIDKEYDVPKEKVDGRKIKGKIDGRKNNGSARTGISKYSHIPTTKGVYYIVDNDKNIYIGSTNVSFIHRYQQHRSKNNSCESKVIISKEHNFEVLYDMSNIEDVELIRMIENEYINYFSNNAEYNLLNKLGNKTKSIHRPKFKFTSKKLIKLVNKEDYSQAVKILKENNIPIKE